MLTHLTAHALGHAEPLDRHCRFAWLWIRLRERFPQALAVCLMPDHLHLGLPGTPADAAATLAQLLRAQARTFRLGRTWGPVAEPVVSATPDKMSRQLRYILLNPCRPTRLQGKSVSLVDDPLCWWWSTHRDTLNAVVEPWVKPERLAAHLGDSATDFAARWHRYVSSDPAVQVHGTPMPHPAPARTVPVHPLEDVLAAALAATRAGPAAHQRRSRTRRLFIALAHHEGWRFNAQLARACNMTPRSARRLATAPRVEDLLAARLCLQDRRLR